MPDADLSSVSPDPGAGVVGSLLLIGVMFVPGVLVLRPAVQLFRSGSIACTDKLDLRAVLGRKDVPAGN